MANTISQYRLPSPKTAASRALLAVGVLAILMTRAALAVDPIVVDLIAPSTAAVGETFTVEVTVGAVTALDAAHVILTFDPAVVEFVLASESTAGTFLAGASITPNAQTPGEFGALINVSGVDGVDGAGALLRVDFRAVGNGSADLAIDYAFFGDGGAREIPSVAGIPPILNIGVGPSMSLRNDWLYDPAPGGNGDGIGNPGERLRPRIRLRNDGPGGAQNVRVTLTSSDPALTLLVGEVAHTTWPANEARNNSDLLLEIASDASPHEAILAVVVTADNGGPWQFTVSVPIAYPPVFFELRNQWVFDPTPRANKDGAANPGERIEPRLRLLNAGSEAAQNARVTLTVNDADVTVVQGQMDHGTWPAGEARNNVGLALDIAPGATPHDVGVTADVTADNGGPWRFTFTIPIVGLPAQISYRNAWIFDPDGNGNAQANFGERVQPRIRLLNDGPGIARNVRVSLTIQDPDVTVVTGEVVHAVWPVGEARNNGGLLLEISPNATSHDVSVVVDVTADNGGPWQFTYAFPVVAPAVTFAKRSHWLYEPTASTRDGQGNAGERVQPRVRLLNVGPQDAQNVTVTLTTDDPDITIVTGQVAYGAWAAGAAKNNNGLVLDIAGNATSHNAALTVTVNADNGGPWTFDVTIPIVAPALTFSLRNAWVFDPTPRGDKNGVADAGERVLPRVRLLNGGPADAQNATVTLTTDDSDITIVTGQVTYGTWAAGAAKNNNGLVLDIAGNATSHNAALTVTVNADNGGPW
ncbi:hypothetical protein HOK31_04415, partial [Candidatus Poribacteria bacterium]|nr:hypothetical protein [Candidatus Poribacteria bacterium]